MSDVNRCSSCKEIFVKTKKGYTRRSVLSVTSPRTSRLAFSSFSPTEKSYLCHSCLRKLNQKTVWKGKKRTWASLTPTKSPRSHAAKIIPSGSRSPAYIPPRGRRGRSVGSGPVAKAHYHLCNYSYTSLFRELLKVDAAKVAFLKVSTDCTNEERKELMADSDGPFRKLVTPENLEGFSWGKVLEWAEEKAPVTLMCLRGMFPPVHFFCMRHSSMGEEKKRMKEAEAKDLLEKRMGIVLSITTYTGSFRKSNFVQACLSVEMWRQGCSQKFFKTMNSLGISQSVVSARGHVDRLRLDHDHQVKRWKKEVEIQPTRRRLFEDTEINRANSYSLTWDNVQMLAHSKHQSADQGNKFHLWAFRFAHRNRVNSGLLSGPVLKAVAVPPHSILPSQKAYNSLQQRMIILVMRILADNLSALQGPKKMVQRHIPHQYTDKMQEKSTVVSLGVVSSNPSTTAGVLDIMDGLQDFVPVVRNVQQPVLCCGDGLSIERMIHCHRARSNGANPSLRFEGLVEAPQEFHKEIILLQDTMNLLYRQDSEHSRGTLSQIKGYFTHKSLRKNVKDNIQHVWDFMEFVTGAYVSLCATTLCNIESVEQTPEDYPEEVTQQMAWLMAIAKKVVDFAWMPPDMEDIKIAAATAKTERAGQLETFPFCSCEQEKDGVMVQCCSNLCGGSWFHLACVNLEDAPPDDEDWFCSEACEDGGSYIYCYCHERQGGEMVQCELADSCRRFEWYHVDCLNPAEQVCAGHPQWYCSETCLVNAEGEDQVQNYSKAVIWEGLCHMARRDAVREGDGDAMTEFWKMDLVNFWDKRHPKYFIIAYQMLNGMEGFYPDGIRDDLRWNLVANLQGKPGGNIGLDLVNEMMNNEFKDMLRRSRGMYTDKQIDRCAEMSGSFGKDLDRMFSEAGIGDFMSPQVSQSSKSAHQKRQSQDIAKLVRVQEGWVACLPTRQVPQSLQGVYKP